MKELVPEAADLGKYLVRKVKGRESFQKKRELKLVKCEEPTDNYN